VSDSGVIKHDVPQGLILHKWFSKNY